MIWRNPGSTRKTAYCLRSISLAAICRSFHDASPPQRNDASFMTDPLPRAVPLSVPPAALPGDLTVPQEARALVLFAHGSGSSRLSPRNRQVAAYLNGSGLATLLFDLLTNDEAADRANVFDISLLAERLGNALDLVRSRADTAVLPVGLFGASTGAAAALVLSARRPGEAFAVVSRGGRPDLAGDLLSSVAAPTLLIVGSADIAVLELNRQAQRQLGVESELAAVPDATHLFEEPGALEAVARFAAEWFLIHAPRGSGS